MRRALLVFSVTALSIVAGCKKENRAPEPLAASPEPQPTPAAPAPAPEAAAPVAAQPTAPPPIQSAPAAPAAPTAAKAKTGAPKPSTSAPAASASAAAPDAGKVATASQALKQIQTCCAAIGAAAKQPGKNQTKYSSAATTCQALAASVKAGKTNAASAPTLIRAQLQGVPLPAGC